MPIGVNILLTDAIDFYGASPPKTHFGWYNYG